MIEIRKFNEDDYEAFGEILQANDPDSPFSVEAMRHFDKQTGPKYKQRRWVGVADGQVVGVCQMNHGMGNFNADELWLLVEVHPDHQRGGYGAALYVHLLAEAQGENPSRLKTRVKEHSAGGMAFAAKQGYEEYARRFDSVLDVLTANLSPFLSSLEKAASHDIQIKTYAELRDAPDFARKMYELNQVTLHDIPFPDPITEEMTFEEFRDRYLNGPSVLNDGSFIALHGDEYVGLTVVIEPAPERVYVGYTAIRGEHRRKGIATALKVRSIEYAREQGYKTMGTTNDTVNEAILSLNTAIGFVRQPAQVLMVRHL